MRRLFTLLKSYLARDLLRAVLAVAFLLNISTVSFAVDQDVSPPDPKAAAQQAQPSGQTAVSDAQAQSSGQTAVSDVVEKVSEPEPGFITMDFKDANIHDVLRILSYKSGLNIVASPDVEGTITIQLTDVPWEKALDVILKTYGFAYERDGNILRVARAEDLEQEALKTKVLRLKYSKAYDTSAIGRDGKEFTVPGLTETVTNMLTARGSVRPDRRSNAIIVTDIPSNLAPIEDIVRDLDRPTAQVVIEAKIVETTLAEGENLGIDWQIKVIAKGSKIPTTLPFNRTFQHMPWQTKYMPLPTPIKQEVDYDSQGNPIVTTDLAEFPTSGTVGSAGVSDVGAPGFPYTGPGDFMFGTLDFSQFQAVLEILKQRSDTNIVSNPKITVLDNQRATIHVGQTLNLPTFERNQDTGNMEITGYKREDTIKLGVTLDVTPNINGTDEVTLAIKPSLSSLLRYDTLTPEVSAPVIQERTASTEVVLKDGQTLAIGGLITERDTKKLNKVPVLGDIRLLGYLFTKSEKSKEKIDLMFFITVHIIDATGAKFAA